MTYSVSSGTLNLAPSDPGVPRRLAVWRGDVQSNAVLTGNRCKRFGQHTHRNRLRQVPDVTASNDVHSLLFYLFTYTHV